MSTSKTKAVKRKHKKARERVRQRRQEAIAAAKKDKG